MPEQLPDPFADRTEWWRSAAETGDPDDVDVPGGGRPDLSTLAAIAAGAALAAIIPLTLAGAFAGGALGDAAAGASSALTAVSAPLLVVFVAALAIHFGRRSSSRRHRAREEATHREVGAWATAHGLGFTARGDLPQAAPLLARGSRRWAANLASGPLPGGLPGVVANYTYVIDGDESGRTHVFPHTVVVARLPETIGLLPELTVEPRGRMATPARVRERLRGRHRVALGSGALARRFDVHVRSADDEDAVRRLMTPSVAEWLSERTPAGMAIDLRDGILCVSVPREVVEPAWLDAFCRTASFIAARLRQFAEHGRSADPPRPALPPPVVAPPPAGAPPPDAAIAAAAYRGVAAREPRTWLEPLGLTALGFGAGLALEGIVAAVALALLCLALTAPRAIRQRSQTLGKDAFLRAYARGRDLQPVAPREFHARYPRAPLPGAAEFAADGRLPVLERPGSLVLGVDRGGDGDVEYVALVVAAHDGMPATRVAPTSQAPGIACEGGTLVVYSERSRSSPLSVAELDATIERAARSAADARDPAAAQA